MTTPQFPTRIEARAGRAMSPSEIFEVANRREKALSRLLVTYISTGLVFMLLPGTFLGVWNLISISSRRASESISPAPPAARPPAAGRTTVLRSPVY